MEKKRRKLAQCPNCSYTFEDINNFCPNCGQENHDLNVPVKHLIAEFFEGTLHYDTKFLKTLKYLLIRPGLLTEKFNIGQRASYVPPFRLYVFISFVFFFLVAINHNILNLKASNNTKETAAVRQATAEAIKQEQLNSGSIVRFDPQDSALAVMDTTNGRIGLEFGDTGRANFLENKFSQFLNNSEQSRAKLLKNFSLMMFVLMPFFAYLLYLFYIKQRRNYVEHLMFSIHLHSFIFIVLSIVLLLNYVLPSVDLLGWVFLIVLIYTFIALRQVYKRSFWRTFFKMIPIVLIYNITLFVFFIGTLFISALL